MKPRKEQLKKEMRVVFSESAYERVLKQAVLLDQTPASFARQIIMEKVTALEAAGSQGGAIGILQKMLEQTEDVMEEQRK